MTLILALVGNGEVVLAADSQASSGDGGGLYTCSVKKLRSANSGRWIVGVANNHAGWALVDHIESTGETFNVDIHIGANEYANRTKELYEKYQHAALTSFVLAGTSPRDAAIYSWSLRRSGPRVEFDGILPTPEQSAVGAHQHGGMHFAHRFHTREMTTPQRIQLAHLCVSEACHQDPRVDFPVEVGLIRLNKTPQLFTPTELKDVQKRSEHISSEIRRLVISSNPEISSLR